MVTLLILFIGLTIGYDLKCPVPAEWRLRANMCHSEDKYVCIYDLLAKEYTDNCSGSDLSSIGGKLVFQPNFNLAECNADRFQPIVFTTHGNSECIFLKSKCDEEGQVVYSNGSNSTDSACRCDYKKGYAFVSRPNNTCFCIPSEEDCSCIRVKCTQLSPDYQCITDVNEKGITNCQEIQQQVLYNTHNKTLPFNERYIKRNNVPYLIIILIISITVYIFIAVLKVYVSEDDGMQKHILDDGRQVIIQDIESDNNIQDDGRYTEYKKRQTFEEDKRQMFTEDEQRQKFIRDLVLKGECGNLHFARLVFIGKNGVGKTSLMRRLLWERKDNVNSTLSTDGIEIEKCNINIKDGKWSKCDTIDDDLSRLIKQAYAVKSLNETETEVENAAENAAENIPVEENFEHETAEQIDEQESEFQGLFQESRISESEKSIAVSSKISNNSTRISEFQDDVETAERVLNEIQQENNTFQNLFDKNVTSNKKENDNEPHTDENISQMTSEIIKSFPQRKETEESDTFAFCWLWDFAGQKDFYATHQVFLSQCAVFLLVTDSLEFSNAEKPGNDFEDAAEYVSFWFDAIHCYWSTTEEGRLDPPIIVVCTNEDKIENPSERMKRQEIFKENLGKVLKNQKKKRHLRSIHFVSNTEDDDSVFEEIREDISAQAMLMKDWGRVCPLKWLLFQMILGRLKESDVPISSTTKLMNIAKHDDIGITNDEEFKHCLQYCHDNGTVIYFDEENLKDHVILDPKWLVDAFRCLVSDKIENVIRVSDDWQKMIETGELTDSLISDLFRKEPKLKFLEYKTHLIEVMKRFDIIVNLKNSSILYMPCMMKSCTFQDVQKQFLNENQSFYRSSWLCLEFEFLPPAFFNHILAWYIKQYSVSIVLDKENSSERNALYRQIGVFDLDSSGCEQLVVCEGTNIIALQIWNSLSAKTYGYLAEDLFQFVKTLQKRYHLQISYTKSFKCKEGKFAINRKKINDLVTKDYRCLEHMTNHVSDDLVIPWNCIEELRQERDILQRRKSQEAYQTRLREEYPLISDEQLKQMKEERNIIEERDRKRFFEKDWRKF